MKSTRTLLSALGAALVLGLLAGLTVAGPSAGADPPATTTDAVTTSTTPDTTSTAPATTAADTSTAASTSTTTPETTAPTTTVGSTVSATNTAPTMGQTTTQAASSPSGTTNGTTTAPPPTTTAPCDTTAITCGNNAATQLAIVSQKCDANSSNTVLNVEIQTLDGHPVNNVTISPETSCMNVLNITQIVHQYCVACTVVVIPPPTVINNVTNVAPSPVTVQRVMGYCTDNGLQYLQEGQPMWDPAYAKAFPGTYVPGVGMTCPDASAQPTVPMFTLTVPASLVGQYLNLCLDPGNPKLKPVCHAVRIDTGATVAIPITSNVKATVIKVKKAKPKAKVTSKKLKPGAVGKTSDEIAALANPTKKKPAAPHSVKHHVVKGARP